MEAIDVQAIVQAAIDRLNSDHENRMTSYRDELAQERRHRQELERRLNELVAENNRTRETGGG